MKRIPLDEVLLSAIQLAQKINKVAYRCQIQLIGKLLRKREIVEPIQTALDKIKTTVINKFFFYKLETLRDDLIHKGEEVIPSVVLALYPEIDRQQLRNLIRNTQKEKINKNHQNYPNIFFNAYVRKRRKN